MIRHGPPALGTPISYSPQPSHWNARTSGALTATRYSWRCTGPSRPMARRVTITTPFPPWLSASVLPTNSPGGVRRGNGCGISMNRPAALSWATPSGKIEIASATIAGFGYSDCPGHPAWLAPGEGAGSPIAARYPLQLIANQPATRLHSQLDFGATSLKSKIKRREPVRIHPQDAAARNIRDSDIVRLYNDRGACLAGAVLSEALRPGVVQLATGAWYDPD